MFLGVSSKRTRKQRTINQELMENVNQRKSPKWGPTTKLVVGLTLVAIAAAVLLYFRSIISSLVLAFILTYLFHPVVMFLHKSLRISWRFATSIIFLIFILLLGGIFTVTGFALASQLQSLVRLLQDVIGNLPQLASDLEALIEQYGTLGEFINLNNIANRMIDTIQPLLGQAGAIVRSLATGAAVSIGKIFFVVAISYFLLADASRVPNLNDIPDIPEYNYDFRRLGRELRKIWNAFLRGQVIIFVLVFIVYSIVLSILGVRYAIALAVMTGLARFVPYVGPFITAIVMALVTLLQPSNYFGLLHWQYAILVLGIAFSIDFFIDNYVAPSFFGRTLGIHPAAVLVFALVAANLFGILGLFLAAPVAATLKLFGRYVLRKMFDLDPWPDPEEEEEKIEYPWFLWGRKVWRFLKSMWGKLQARFEN